MAPKEEHSITEALKQDTFQTAESFQMVQEDLRAAEKERLQTAQRRKELLSSLRRSTKKNHDISDESDARRKELLRLLHEGGLDNVEVVASRLKRELGLLQSRHLVSNTANTAARKFFQTASVYLERSRLREQLDRKSQALQNHSGLSNGIPNPMDVQKDEKITAAIQKMSVLNEALRRECDRLQEGLCSTYNALETLLVQDRLENERVRTFFHEGISALDEEEQHKIMARCQQLCQGASMEKRRSVYLQVIERLATFDQRVALHIHRVSRRKCRELIKTGRYEQAIKELKYAISLWRDDASTHRMLASVCFRKRDDEGALAALLEVIRLNPDDATLTKRVASHCEKMGRLHDAITYYKETLRLAKDNDSTLKRELGRLSVEVQRYEDAILFLNDYLLEFPEDNECLAWIGLAYNQIGRPECAVGFLRSVLDANPEHNEIVQQLALAYRKLSLYNEAIDVLSSRLSSDKFNISLGIMLGSTYQENGEWEKAEQLFLRILEKNPSSASLLQALAEVRMANGRLQDAVKAYENALRIAPRKASIYVDLSRAYRKTGKTTQAESLLANALNVFKDSIEIRQELAAIYTELGRWDEAVSMLQTVQAHSSAIRSA